MLNAGSFRRRGDLPLLMGILNVTPDSFSDGGLFNTVDKAVSHALQMVDEGADIIDIGGESTRPGAVPVPAEEELSRLIPVIDSLEGVIDVPISVDTSKASVAEECIRHGACLVNDVSSLHDPHMASAVAASGVPIVLMSSYGDPSTFRTSSIPGDGRDYIMRKLGSLVSSALDAGVDEDMMILDPGVGFGTSADLSMDVIRHASDYSLGRFPVLVGPSRKRFLSRFYPGMDADDATAEVCRIAADSGADILRVHAPGRIRAFLEHR